MSDSEPIVEDALEEDCEFPAFGEMQPHRGCLFLEPQVRVAVRPDPATDDLPGQITCTLAVMN